jgi:hypothetical protein
MLSELDEVPQEATVGGGVWNFAVLNPSLLVDGAAAAKKAAVRKKDKPTQQAILAEKTKPSVERSTQRTLSKAAPAFKGKPAAPPAAPQGSEGAQPPPILPRWFPQETGAEPVRPPAVPKPDFAKASPKRGPAYPEAAKPAAARKIPASPLVVRGPAQGLGPAEQEIPPLNAAALSAIWQQLELGASGFRPPWDTDSLAVQLEWLRLLSQTAQLQAQADGLNLLNGSAAGAAPRPAKVDARPPAQPKAARWEWPKPAWEEPKPNDPEAFGQGQALLKMLKAGQDKENWSAPPFPTTGADGWGQDWNGAENWWNSEDWSAEPVNGAAADWAGSKDVETESQGRALLDILKKPKTEAAQPPAPKPEDAGSGDKGAQVKAPVQPAAQPAVQPAVQQAVQQAAQQAAKQAALQAAKKPAAAAAPPAQSVLEALLQSGAQLAGQPPAPYMNGWAEKHFASEKKHAFPKFATTQEHVERDLLKEVDSRPPSGPEAGLVADPEAGRFLLMQLKGPETIAREDGKKLLNHLRRSIEREDERKASRFMKLLTTNA